MSKSTSTNSSYENYAHDLGILVRELALDARQAAKDRGSDFSVGYMAGFHRVISLMQQQAEAFGIPLEKLALDNFDPDLELV
jgi:hypothetical protein